MKKNISINISGIIFHIEEDGYETLKTYLDSINRYFSTFDDSSEILADIESRIAEIFLSKLNAEKQVITSDDVNALVLTMGSVSDFRAAEEPESVYNADTTSKTENIAQPISQTGAYSYSPHKRLMRDQKRKILGGVCAGLANYLNVDVLWIRLLFAFLTIGYGVILIVYILMWILVPGSYDLDEPIVSKRMYRDPERKVIGGVSGGVAAYLGTDIVVIRVLFIIMMIAGGLGLFIYILLWVVLPEARTLTDKMQMQGERVTLSNIESSLKKTQSERPVEEENTISRILLFPFRLIGIILTALSKVIGPLVDVVRVAIGVIIILIGVSFLLAIILSTGLMVGVFSAAALEVPWMQESTIPIDAFIRAFPAWTSVAAFLGTLVPSIFIILLGVSVIAQRIVFNAATGWTLFVLFFVSVAMLAVGIPKIIFAFKKEAEYKIENTYKLNGKTAIFQLNETEMDGYRAVTLNLRGHADSTFKLIQAFESQGGTRAKALENAKMVEYTVDFKDSVFIFDSNLQFKDDAIFRAQRLTLTLYIPYNIPFTMDEEMSRFISNYVDGDYLDGYTWKMTEEGITCISCPSSNEDESTNISDFDEIEISGKFDMRIVSGDHYSVELTGSENTKEKYDIHRTGETLIINFDGKKDRDWKLKDLNIEEVKITITMPSLEKIEATGVGSIRLDDFTGDDMDFDIHGPVKLRADDINAQNLTINLTGSAQGDFSGHANNLNARIEFASKLRAYNLEVKDAFVETSGASSAKINVTGSLEMEEGISSHIDFRGNPKLTKRD